MVKRSPEHQGNNNNNNDNNKGDNSNNNSNSNSNSNSSIKYKGVRKRKWGKWVSEVRLPNSRERIWLGSYDTPEKAARAFDAAQFCLRGKSANFNFPNDPPEIAGGRSMSPPEIQAAAASFANTATSNNNDISVAMDNKSEENHIMLEESTEALSYSSPSISDGTTVQMDSFEVAGVETSFQEQLSLSTTLGSGNYVSDFGYFPGFDEFTGGDFFTTMTQSNNFEYVGQEDTYDASLYQDSYLWNF